MIPRVIVGSFSVLLLGALSFFFTIPRTISPRIAKSERAYERIVSLAPSMSDTMAFLNEARRVVGITIHCDETQFPHAQKIGSFAEPNFEAILALKPDLVLAVPHIMAKNTLKQLELVGVDVFAHQPDTLADIKFIVSAIANKLNIANEGFRVNQNIDEAIAKTRLEFTNVASLSNNKSMLIAVSFAPFVVAGKNTFPSQIMEALGFKNMADDPKTAWPVWSLEGLLSKPPEVLVLADGKENFSRYQNLFRALGLDVKKVGIHLLVPEKMIFYSPSPALINDISYLSKLLQ